MTFDEFERAWQKATFSRDISVDPGRRDAMSEMVMVLASVAAEPVRIGLMDITVERFAAARHNVPRGN